ncbi:MAG: hypothetical protein Q7N87_04390 [Candidatus Uhrbacteria bacterium]|nr:hypothetical protein [Candidatus Uhrbacteria bacterium]MDP3794248.1 hypothetical protein [Candidatus Uhrbacteria bacterium]
MKIWLKILIVTFLFGAPTLPLGEMLWPVMTMPEIPTSTQLGLLIVVGVIESIAFGLGVAFLIFGWKTVKRVIRFDQTLAKWMYASIGWTLVSWWPHDRLHMHYGLQIKPLIGIEYAFHVTLIVASLIIAYGFLRILRALK